jgi:hypothetical protein
MPATFKRLRVEVAEKELSLAYAKENRLKAELRKIELGQPKLGESDEDKKKKEEMAADLVSTQTELEDIAEDIQILETLLIEAQSK